MQLKEFRIRASAIAQIMGKMGLTEIQESKLSELLKRNQDSLSGIQKPLTDKMKEEMNDLIDRKKNSKLPQTCISYLEQWAKEQIYNTRKQVKSKYLTKGIDVESLAIEYYSEVNGLGFVLPNIEHFSNDFMTGTPDLIHGIVYEFKSSWDCFTFPLFETEIDFNYWCQCQGYMSLTGLKSAKLVYTLQNTPDELVWDEPVDYTDLDSKYRIKEFEIEYDPEFIESVKERVLLCREYLMKLI